MNKALVCLAAFFLAGCSHGGSGSGGASSLAPISSAPGGTSPTSSSTNPGSTTPTQKGFDGVWDVAGTDPIRGAFTGTAEVAVSASGGYTVKRLVTYQTKLPSGDQALAAWNATAREEQGGLRVDVTLRRAHVYQRAGTVTRTAADMQPLALSGLLLASSGPLSSVSIGTKISGAFGATGASGPTESWTRSTTAAPLFPITNVHQIAAHAPPSSTLKATLFATYASYFALPKTAPYVNRPEFQAAIHQVIMDTSAFDFYRVRGPGSVVVVDKITDDVAFAEESRRARAFSRRLVDKAKLFDADMKSTNADPNGMVTAVDLTASPPRHDFSQSPVLYTGIWTLGQFYRYRTTGEQEALDNITRGIGGAVLCVDITPAKTDFARAVDFLANAQPGQVGPAGGKYSWQAGTGQYSNLMWMVGGNNDMLHGVATCFSVAAQVLPAGHPVRAQVGVQAASLLTNCKIAQSGTHEVNLAYAAWTTTGDPAWQKRYTNALGFKNILEKLYTQQGGMFTQYQGTADWSGHGLGTLTVLQLLLLGGANPTPDEQSWRDAATQGTQAGFGMCGLYREGLVDMIAASVKTPGASDIASGVLTEIPYPKAAGDVQVNFPVAAEFCMSPYPSDPWYVDWTKNDRSQSLISYPYFYRPSELSFWNRSPLAYTGGPDLEQEPGVDFLVAYWLGRLHGVIGPTD